MGFHAFADRLSSGAYSTAAIGAEKHLADSPHTRDESTTKFVCKNHQPSAQLPQIHFDRRNVQSSIVDASTQCRQAN